MLEALKTNGTQTLNFLFICQSVNTQTLTQTLSSDTTLSRSKLMAQSRPLPRPPPCPRAMLLRQSICRIERIWKAENKDKFLEVFHLMVLLLKNKEIYNLTDSTT